MYSLLFETVNKKDYSTAYYRIKYRTVYRIYSIHCSLEILFYPYFNYFLWLYINIAACWNNIHSQRQLFIKRGVILSQ